MDKAFPEIRKQFEKKAKQEPWRALFDALGARPVTDPTRRVRIVNVETHSIQVPGQDAYTEATATSASILPHVRVRTVEKVQEHELAELISSDAIAEGKVPAWAKRALRVGNSALFVSLEKLLDWKGSGSCVPNDLPAELEKARGVLNGHAIALLLSEATHAELIGEDALSKQVAQALKGGAKAPVAELTDSSAYVLRYGAGDVVVEIVHELQPHWDIGSAPGSVDLIALQEFVVVAERPVPAYELTLL